MFHVIPLGYGHYIKTNPSTWSTPAASCIVSWQHWNPRLITPCMPSPGFSALERGGWLLVSKGWEMALCQHVSALGACSHSCTSQISESRGGSFLSCSRRANTCSEWTLLSVRRLTSFINIRGNIKRSCRGKQTAFSEVHLKKKKNKKKVYHNWWHTVITILISSRHSILQEDAVWLLRK